MRETIRPSLLGALGALLLGACANAPHPAAAPSGVAQLASQPTPLPLIPQPVDVERGAGAFALHDGTVLRVRAASGAGRVEATYFVDLVARTHGVHLVLEPAGDSSDAADAIVFELDPALALPDGAEDEGYRLNVTPHAVHAAARTPHGLFNAAITLWQLLDAGQGGALPAVSILDYPRFRWRGLMLDSARHFQTPDEIERLLEQMARHKLDVLHWHLTDDQGWRIEIRKYPRLTSVGAWRNEAAVDGKPTRYGGFYTQAQIRAVVAYAAARHILVVPEIEMPGHAQAAIAAYPQFGAAPRRPAVSHDWGVHTYLYNVDERTFAFLEDVLGEVLDLFPSPYIHVGGDEAAKDQWQASAAVQRRMRALGVADEAKLQGWFSARIERYLAAHGRTLVGWDEILEGGVPPRATVMSWRGTQGGIEAARAGHDVIMAPSPVLYFDHVQSDRADEPPGREDPVTLADVYAFEPVPKELDAAQARHVLGAQGNLWSEYLDTPARIDHAAWPRGAALAEALWSPATARDWHGFLARMPAQLARYRRDGVAFADSAFAVQFRVEEGKLALSNASGFGRIRYAARGTDPARGAWYDAPLALPGQPIAAAIFAGDVPLSAPRTFDAAAASLPNDALHACAAGLPLRLPGPAIDGAGGAYHVDLFHPCWIDPKVDLSAAPRLTLAIAALPFNFQLWHDASHVVLRAPGGHVQVRLDGCNGEPIADAALRRGREANVQEVGIALPARAGTHDLCIEITRDAADPFWVIGRVDDPH